jgi:hypothetical protein
MMPFGLRPARADVFLRTLQVKELKKAYKTVAKERKKGGA